MFGTIDILRISLGSFRMGGLLVAMPVIGTSALPRGFRFIFALAISSMISSFLPELPAGILQGNLLFLVLMREIGLGLLGGFSIRFVFLLVTMALDFASIQMGFAIANIFDPQNNSEISVVAQLGAVLSIILFFSSNMHHDVFLALIKTYQIIPIGLPDWQVDLLSSRLIAFLSTIFSISLRLSWPVMVVMLTIHIIMGIISRTAPQMNLFFNVTFIVNIVAGFVLIVLTMPRIYSQMKQGMDRLVEHGLGLI